MPFDNNNLFEDIENHSDIVKTISSYLTVIKKGKNFVAKCPFHDDNDPSLTISPEKRIFKCFVCGTAGRSISFVSKYEHIAYLEAARKVAEINGYEDERLRGIVKEKHVDPKKTPLLKCLKDLTLYYQYALSVPEGKDGSDYFANRQIDDGMIAKYKLGYAPKDGKATCAFLQSRGHSLKTIEDIGIASVNNGTYSDKNQGRVIFPISDIEGNVIGFSARRLKEGPEAKYVNSPETYLFHKSSVLYNVNIAKERARIANCIYVCEGFMDVFALGRIGVDNAVALMGTAFTEEHIAILRSINVEIRLCLDGDVPGQKATMAAASMLQKAGLRFQIVDHRSRNKDSDEIYIHEGPQALELYLKNLLSYTDFALNYYQNSNPLKTIEEKRKLVRFFVPVLLGIRDQLEFDSYLRRLSAITGFDVESIRTLVRNARNNGEGTDISAAMNSFHPERKILRKLQLAEREILYQMLYNKCAVDFYEDKMDFYDEVYRNVANFVVEYCKNHDSIDAESVITMIEASDIENRDELISEVTTLAMEEAHPDKCSPELLNSLYDSVVQEKDKIYEKDILQQSLEGKDPLEQARIMAEFNRRKIRKEREKQEELNSKEE